MLSSEPHRPAVFEITNQYTTKPHVEYHFREANQGRNSSYNTNARATPAPYALAVAWKECSAQLPRAEATYFQSRKSGALCFKHTLT
jgi:hypothetical protein